MSISTNKIGKISEHIAHILFRILRMEGKIFYYLYRDSDGIDFLLLTSTWQIIPIQIKTGYKETIQHIKKYPSIPVITISHESICLNKKDKKRKWRLFKEAKFQALEILASQKDPLHFIFFYCVFIREFEANHEEGRVYE